MFVSVFDKMEIKEKVSSVSSQSSDKRKHKSQNQASVRGTQNYHGKKWEKKPINEDFLANKGPVILLIKPMILSLNIVSMIV